MLVLTVAGTDSATDSAAVGWWQLLLLLASFSHYLSSNPLSQLWCGYLCTIAINFLLVVPTTMGLSVYLHNYVYGRSIRCAGIE